jgi:hypothetical protein
MNRKPLVVADPRLTPLLAMLNRLPDELLAELARNLHAKLNLPASPAERRANELGFLSRLLDELPQYPGRLPYVERKIYDERRKVCHAGAPSSSRLQERFGSWPRACRAAWGLHPDGRSIGDRDPWARPRRGVPYTVEEAEASVRLCAEAVGHVPSSHEYHMWVIARRARARASGEHVRIAHLSSVYRLIAPDRSGGNGWRLVISRLFR